ncbi:MAG TPA: hypothetical protein VNT54_15045, partial [Solirubrobacteraceae bacterium]|nr:hypothetical protein [Solirubrobacteraceae bacterium]
WGIWRTDDATAAATGGLTAATSGVAFTRVKQIEIGDPKVTDRYTVLSASGDVVYAATSEKSGTIYKSTDRGRTFFRDGEKDADGTTPFSSSAQGWGIGTHHGTIAVDPGNPDNVYLGGSYSCALRCAADPRRTVLHSSDGGRRFHIADGPYRNRPEPNGTPTAYVHPDVTDIAFAPNDPNVVYNANDGGIYRAANGRIEEPPNALLESHVSKVYFETRNTEGLGLTQFYNLAVHPRDRHFTMGGTQDNGAVIQLANGGKWRFVGGGDVFNVAIDQTATSTDKLPLYVDCARYDSTEHALLQSHYKTMGDGCRGGFWAQGPGATLAAPDIMYWGIQGTVLRRTTDKGETVAKFYDACSDLSPCPAVTAAATLPSRPDHLLVGHSDGSLRLIEGTRTLWLKQPGNGAPITAIAVDPREDQQRAYVGLGGHLPNPRIYRIDDLLSPDPDFSVRDLDVEDNLELPRLPITSLVIDPQEPDHIFVGTDSGVFASVDGGSTWQPLGEGLPRGCARKGEVCGTRFSVRSARSMAITRNILRVASFARGMWEIQIAPDRTPPEIRFESRTPPANADGWNNGEVVVEWSCTDDESDVKAQRVKETLSEEGADQTAQGVCEDAAGNRATHTIRGIDIDLTAPTITLADRPAANGNGWYREPVTIRWSCQDTLSGPLEAEVRRTLATEGADQSLEGKCTDRAGNTASDTQTDLDIDLTPPVVTYSEHPTELTVAEAISITCTAEDALSGIASHTCQDVAGEGYEFPIGQTVLSAAATDRAGHSASATTSFIVTVDADSLCVLTRRWVTSSDIATSLCWKLEAAQMARMMGNDPAAKRQLLAYRQQLAGQVGKTITRERADILSGLSHHL